jgi:hypothetical protein
MGGGSKPHRSPRRSPRLQWVDRRDTRRREVGDLSKVCSVIRLAGACTYGLPLGTDGKFAGLFSRSRLRLAISAFRSLSSLIW